MKRVDIKKNSWHYKMVYDNTGIDRLLPYDFRGDPSPGAPHSDFCSYFWRLALFLALELPCIVIVLWMLHVTTTVFCWFATLFSAIVNLTNVFRRKQIIANVDKELSFNFLKIYMSAKKNKMCPLVNYVD